MSKPSIFEQNYDDYLAKISEIDFENIAGRLGAKFKGDEIFIPFFGMPYRISRKGIVDSSGKKPPYSVCVVHCKYILLCPDFKSSQDEWVAFKDFKDAAPLVCSFANTTEGVIADYFSGKLEKLEKACKSLRGVSAGTGYSYDLAMKLYPLPKIPMLLLFNDADYEFKADCKVLFEKRAEHYLDMECLAIIGNILSDYLKKAAEGLFEVSDNTADRILWRT